MSPKPTLTDRDEKIQVIVQAYRENFSDEVIDYIYSLVTTGERPKKSSTK